jgi:signal transduction histidine kinase
VTASVGRLAAWALYAAMVVLLVIAVSLLVANSSFELFVVVAILMMIGYGTVGALIASRGKGGPLGWLMLTIGIGFVLAALSDELITYAFRTNPSASVPFVGVAVWMTNWVFFVVLTPILLILLLFPTGTPPSARWRPLELGIVALALAGIVATVLQPGPIDTDAAKIANPTGVQALQPVTGALLRVVAIGLLASAIACVIALIVRFRRSRDDERQQLRWLAYLAMLALALLTATVLSAVAAGPDGESPLNDALWLALTFCVGFAFPVAIGVAILKYRLYDLDLVIKKTVLYSIVALVLVALFLLAAILLGQALIQAHPAAIVASIAIGLAFWPATRLARRLADRIVYGGRATPYEVLTDFSHRVGGSYAAEDVLPRMARILTEAVGAAEAIVWLRVGAELRPAGRSTSGTPVPDPIRTEGDSLPALPADTAVEVLDQGALLGALTVTMPANDPMNPSKERLVRDLASQAGLVLRNVRLIEELRASRQRLVAAQDDERRRLERNIHDGAQQQLVALTVKLRLLEQLTSRDQGKAAELASQLQAETTQALEDLRDLARGIYPPLLADEGLRAALSAQARKAPVPVTIEANGVGRFPEEVEAAVYFSCLEALQNVAKYANASHVTISLARDDGHLRFVVADDGVGFDPDAAHRGTGLQGIADRMDALRGRFAVRSRPGSGTEVSGTLPLPLR